MAQGHTREPRNATRQTLSCNSDPFPLMFLEELRLAYDTIAYNVLSLSLRDLLAFAFLLVLYAYRALGLGCVV